MTRVLLTTVCRPLQGQGQGPSMGVDVMKGQLCVNHGAFRTSGVGLAYGLEYIAENITSPTVILHWPSRAELTRELRRGRYDLIGISFTFQLLPLMAETAALIRRHAPRAKIVLGGYGTAAPEAARHGDLVCAGDGIAYMRRLLGQREGEPVHHPTLVYGNHVFSLPVNSGRKTVLCTGLGCAVGCDFCASSRQFGQRYIPFIEDGDEMFRVMEDLYVRTGSDEFQILDENFLVHEERARRLADRCEATGRHFEFFTFSSVKALSRYSSDELCRIGVSAVWIGLEGKKAGYDKLHGEQVISLVKRLRQHGILVCGSMIIGFDYQTPQLIRQELEDILRMEPTYLQCLIYGPAPRTPLFERIEREGRWLDGGPGKGVPYGQCDGFRLVFQHPTISASEMSRLQMECYELDLQHNGYSLYRAVETWFQGYLSLRDRPQPYLRARARLLARKLLAARPALPVGISHAPNFKIRQRMSELHRGLLQELGPVSGKERLLRRLVLPAAARWTAFKLRHDLFQEPQLIRRSYRC